MSRIGNFTSSQIHRLCTFGRAKGSIGVSFDTYVEEKLIEYRTGVSINKDSNAKPLHWGNFMEGWVFENKMGLEYKLVSKKRYTHPTLLWSGMPDFISDGIVGDIKNPYTIKPFCKMADAIIADDLEAFKKETPEYYWQLISNSVLTGNKLCVLIIHVPYHDELAAIREATMQYDGDQNKIAFMNWATDDELPHIMRDKYYKDLYQFQFEAPQEDVDFLIERVTQASEILTSKIK